MKEGLDLTDKLVKTLINLDWEIFFNVDGFQLKTHILSIYMHILQYQTF